MAVNKVVYGNDTLIDLTNDTVTAEDLASGKIAHDMSGAQIVGTNTYDSDTQDGTATEADLLTEKTAYARGSKLTGTMANNGAVKGKLKTVDDVYGIPVGYHDGSGTVDIDETEAAKLIPENVREGVEILGVTGTMSGEEGVTAQAKVATPMTSEQVILPDAGYNYLTQVTVEAIPYTETENAAGGTTVTIG